MTIQVFNPLDKLALAESIEAKLLEQPSTPMADTSAVDGAGIYAIYYSGPFELYRPIAEIPIDDPTKPPIYVGKAAPIGSRKGGLKFDVVKSKSLRSRLRKHAGVIASAGNLELEHFEFRNLVVDDVWIPLGENILIENFRPLWNVVIDGFGNNKPGVNREKQKRSAWDTLHPGRSWAALTKEPDFTVADVHSKVRKALS